MSLMLKALLKSIEYLWVHSIAKSGLKGKTRAGPGRPALI